MGNVCGRVEEKPEIETLNFSTLISSGTNLSFKEQTLIQIDKLNILIDAYNKEVIKLNRNLRFLYNRVIHYKSENDEIKKLFYFQKFKQLEEKAIKLSANCKKMLERKERIDEMNKNLDNAGIMREINELLKKHINADLINDIQQLNDIYNECIDGSEAIDSFHISEELRYQYNSLLDRNSDEYLDHYLFEIRKIETQNRNIV